MLNFLVPQKYRAHFCSSKHAQQWSWTSKNVLLTCVGSAYVIKISTDDNVVNRGEIFQRDFLLLLCWALISLCSRWQRLFLSVQRSVFRITSNCLEQWMDYRSVWPIWPVVYYCINVQTQNTASKPVTFSSRSISWRDNLYK